jgi:hypothetical protein
MATQANRTQSNQSQSNLRILPELSRIVQFNRKKLKVLRSAMVESIVDQDAGVKSWLILEKPFRQIFRAIFS